MCHLPTLLRWGAGAHAVWQQSQWGSCLLVGVSRGPPALGQSLSVFFHGQDLGQQWVTASAKVDFPSLVVWVEHLNACAAVWHEFHRFLGTGSEPTGPGGPLPSLCSACLVAQSHLTLCDP